MSRDTFANLRTIRLDPEIRLMILTGLILIRLQELDREVFLAEEERPEYTAGIRHAVDGVRDVLRALAPSRIVHRDRVGRFASLLVLLLDDQAPRARELRDTFDTFVEECDEARAA